MSALAIRLQERGDEVAEAFAGSRPRRVCVHGRAGQGKSEILSRAADRLREGHGRPTVTLRAVPGPIGATAALASITAQLVDQGYVGVIDDSMADEWPRRLHRAHDALRRADENDLVVVVGDHDRLATLSRQVGAPARHARDVVRLIDQRPRVVTSRVVPDVPMADRFAADPGDLTDWLLAAETWGELAASARAVAGLGPEWTTLPALTIRLLVGTHAVCGALDSSPPATPEQAANRLATTMAVQRRHRQRWAAWQLVSMVRPSLHVATLDALLRDVDCDLDDAILGRCLTHEDPVGRRVMHPAVRQVGLASAGGQRPVAGELVRAAGRRTYRQLAGAAETSQTNAAATSHLHAQMLDCAAMSEDPAEAGGEDLPDPYDHVGETTRDEASAETAYRHARELDRTDAYAIRGLAKIAAERHDHADAAALLTAALELEPADTPTRARLCEALLAAGRPAAAERALDAVLALAPDDERQRALSRIARSAMRLGDFHLAALAARAASSSQPESSVRLRRIADGLVEALEYGEFVGASRLGTRWWERPAKLAARDGDLRLDRWLAGRVDSEVDGMLSVEYADVLDARERPSDVSWLELPRDAFLRLCADEVTGQLPGQIVEVGVYVDPAGGDTTKTVIRLVGDEFDAAELEQV